MTKRSIDFDDEYLWKTQANNNKNRPYTKAILWYNKNPHFYWCLVDSGADYMQLDETAAIKAGINLSNAVRKSVNNASGAQSTLYLVHNIDVEIEKEMIKTDILFGKGIPPLLGRMAFLKAMAVCIDNPGWLYRT